MKYFFERIVKPFIIESHYYNILEIGAEYGYNTDKLISNASTNLTIIDPCIAFDLEAKYKGKTQIKVLKGLSLNFLPKISGPFDSILIDGDHNWYTVFNELKIIAERNLIKEGGAIFFHDVSWPYARRDMYYSPESIPKEFRHPYAKQGMEKGKSELLPSGGLNPDLYNALYEGGQRNGVRTAIDDFLAQFGKDYFFFDMKTEFGLGVLIRKKNLKTFFTALRWFLILKCYELRTHAGILIKHKILHLQE